MTPVTLKKMTSPSFVQWTILFRSLPTSSRTASLMSHDWPSADVYRSLVSRVRSQLKPAARQKPLDSREQCDGERRTDLACSHLWTQKTGAAGAPLSQSKSEETRSSPLTRNAVEQYISNVFLREVWRRCCQSGRLFPCRLVYKHPRQG